MGRLGRWCGDGPVALAARLSRTEVSVARNGAGVTGGISCRNVTLGAIRQGADGHQDPFGWTWHPASCGPGRAPPPCARDPRRCYDLGMGASHILLILIVVLIIVIIWRGPTTLPLIGRAFGQGVKEARKEIREIKTDLDKKPDGPDGQDPPAAPPA